MRRPRLGRRVMLDGGRKRVDDGHGELARAVAARRQRAGRSSRWHRRSQRMEARIKPTASKNSLDRSSANSPRPTWYRRLINKAIAGWNLFRRTVRVIGRKFSIERGRGLRHVPRVFTEFSTSRSDLVQRETYQKLRSSQQTRKSPMKYSFAAYGVSISQSRAGDCVKWA